MGFVTTFKIFSAVGIFLTTLIGNSLPLCIRAPMWTHRAESLAAGVFFGAGLAHLLADANDDLSKYKYPVGPATSLAMFALLTLIELFSFTEHDADAFDDHEQKSQSIPSLEDSTFKSMSDIDSRSENPSQGTDNRALFGKSNSKVQISTISLYIIMVIHSLIEGFALGILETKSGVIAIFCAIIGHKPVEAFALSLIILKDKPTKFLFWLLVIIYCLFTPIGVIASLFIGQNASDIVKGIIAAISAGTFLFVGCNEWSEMIGQKKERTNKEKIWHFVMFLIGLIWMLGIAIVEVVAPED